MQLNPYLFFNGQCEAAFKFYEQTLGGKITAMMTHEGAPETYTVPPEWKKKIMHASLSIGDQQLMASDVPEKDFEKPQGFYVSLQIKDPADAERVFEALSKNGKVNMPIQKTFWAQRFGMLASIRYTVDGELLLIGQAHFSPSVREVGFSHIFSYSSSS